MTPIERKSQLTPFRRFPGSVAVVEPAGNINPEPGVNIIRNTYFLERKEGLGWWG